MSLVNGAVITVLLVPLIGRHRKSPTMCKLFDPVQLHLFLLGGSMMYRQAIASDVQELLRRVADLENCVSQLQAQRQLSNQTPMSSVPWTTLRGAQYSSTQGHTPSSIEGKTTSQTLPSSLASPSTIPSPYKRRPREIGHVTRYLGQNWYHKGIPILSEMGQDWIRSKTVQDAQFEIFHLFGSKRGHPTLPLVNFSDEQLHKLPNRESTQRCLDGFFESSFCLFYPVIDRFLINETLEAAYQDSHDSFSSRSQVSAKACILAALAMITQAVRPKDCSSPLQCEVHTNQAQYLLSLASWEESLETLQATLMLVRTPKLDGVSRR